VDNVSRLRLIRQGLPEPRLQEPLFDEQRREDRIRAASQWSARRAV